MRKRPLSDSFNDAVNGILYTFRTQQNMRLHLVAAGLVLLLSLFLDLARWETIVLFFTIILVLIMEMLNTAVEVLVDLVTREYHPLARQAKHIAAGAVLLAALNAVVVGYLLFAERLSRFHPFVLHKVAQVPAYITFVALMLVLLLVLIVKVTPGKDFAFQGGMPSGHTAVASALATIIFFLSRNGFLFLLAAAIAFLVGQSRVEGRIHLLSEVLVGALLGILVVTFVFQITGYRP